MKYPSFVALKMPTEVVLAARAQAEADGRPLSNYLRRIVTEAVQRRCAVEASALDTTSADQEQAHGR